MEVIESGKLIYTDEIRKGFTTHVSAIDDFDEGVKAANNSDIAIIKY